MTSRKFAWLAAGAAGGADIGLWIVEKVLSCCKRHIPRALRGGHRTKENNYSKLSEQKGGWSRCSTHISTCRAGTYHNKEENYVLL